MPALTITAVDHTTGQLTIPAHGLLDGDGPAALFAGAGGVIPTGLAPVTDYWAHVLDANTVQLADSSTHALAGTTLGFTDDGTLPLSLLVGLPYRRARTYVALAQLKSADLDALQDDDVALWNFLTGQAQSVYSGIKLAADQNIELQGTGTLKYGTRTLSMDGSAFVPAPGATPTYAAGTGLSDTPLNAMAPLVLPVGVHVTEIRFYVKDNAAGPTKLEGAMSSGDHAGGSTPIASTPVSAGTGAAQTLSITGGDAPIVAGHSYWLAILTSSGAGAASIYAVEVDYYQP